MYDPRFAALRSFGAAALAGALVALAACSGDDETSPPGDAAPAASAPVVTAQPADASVTAPAAAVFSAAASGTPAPSVQWQRSSDGGSTWAAIAGATAASYTTPGTVAGDDGARFRAVFANAAGSATTNAGRLTVTSTNAGAGLSLLAGSLGGAGTIDGTGSGARFDDPVGMAHDAAGNLYVADWHEHTIRKITPAGVVTTFAGRNGVAGSVDGIGTDARFNAPTGLAVDAGGNVYVADFGSGLIRKITPAGLVTTLAGGGRGTTAPGSADGVGAAARFAGPIGVAIDSHGDLFVTDQNLYSIRKVTPAGVVTTFAGSSSGNANTYADGTGAAARFRAPQSIAIDAADNLYVGDGAPIRKITPAAVVTTIAASLDVQYARGLAVCPSGDLFVADTNANVVRRIDAAGTMTTFAGTVRASFVPAYADGTGAAAALDHPAGIACDAAGTLFVSEEANHVVRKITPAAAVTTFAGLVPQIGRDDGVGAAARFEGGGGLAVDASGNLFLADAGGNSIRRITPGGVVTTYAGADGQFGSDDGTTATAHFRQPANLAFDAAGNLYVADSNNYAVRKITPAGIVTTLAGSGSQGHADGTGTAASFAAVDALAVDAAGNVYVAESLANVVRKITPAGVVSTFAGQAYVSGSADGTGSAATFYLPYGLAIDRSGNLIVADSENSTLRKITPQGVVTTLAGTPAMLGSADGTGAAARFRFPTGVTTDADGNAYVADIELVRKVTPAGVVTTAVGVPSELGVRLGTDPRLGRVGAVAWLPAGRLAIVSEPAVLLFTLP